MEASTEVSMSWGTGGVRSGSVEGGGGAGMLSASKLSAPSMPAVLACSSPPARSAWRLPTPLRSSRASGTALLSVRISRVRSG